MNKKILGFSIIGLLILLMAYLVFANIDVRLLTPGNNTWNTSRSVNFTFNVTLAYDNVTNCSLWTNESGWSLKQTNTSPITMNITAGINVTFGADAHYLWNIQCYNTSGDSLFNNTNYTIKIDATAPVVILNYPTNNTYDRNGNITFNFTTTEANPGNCSLYINLSSGGEFLAANQTEIAYTSGTQTNFSTLGWNLSTEGVYLWNVYCNDSAGNAAWYGTNFTVTHDAIPPFIGLDTINNTNYTSGNFSSGWASVNITINDTYSTITCNISVNGVVKNESLSVANDTKTEVKVLGFVHGINNWNVTCWDAAGNVNRSMPGGHKHYILNVNDAVAPSVNTPTVSSTSVTKGTTVTLSACTGSDNVDTSVGTSLEVKGPLTGDEYSTTDTSFEGTTETGTYTVRCSVTDDAGNVGRATTTFTAKKKTQTYPAAAAGAAPTVATEIVRGGKTSDVGILTEYGASKLMAVDSTLTFTIDAVAHSVKVKEVGTDYVVLEISSDPMEVTVKANETKKVDLDGDGVNDLEVTLHGISYGKGDFTFKRIEEVAEEVVAEEEEEVITEEEEIPTVPSRLGLWITILVIIAVVVVGYYMVRKRKGKKAQVKFTEKDLK